jgi:hypothetical protein
MKLGFNETEELFDYNRVITKGRIKNVKYRIS